MEINIYSKDIQSLEQEYSTNLNEGLSVREAQNRLEKYGKNELEQPPKRSLLLRFFDQLKDFMILILILASLLSFTMAIIHQEPGELFEGIIIIGIVLLNALLGIFQESKAEKSLENIKKLSTPHVTVVRDGIEMVIDV